MLAISSPQLAQKTIPSSEGLLLLARSVFTIGFYASVISSFPEWWVFVKIRELRNQVRGLVNSNKWRWRVRARCLVLLRVRPFTGAGQLVSRLAGTHWVLQRNGVLARLLAHLLTTLSSGEFRNSVAECVSHPTVRSLRIVIEYDGAARHSDS